MDQGVAAAKAGKPADALAIFTGIDERFFAAYATGARVYCSRNADRRPDSAAHLAPQTTAVLSSSSDDARAARRQSSILRPLRRPPGRGRATTPPRDAETQYRANAATCGSKAGFAPPAWRSLPIPAPAPDTSQPSVDWSFPRPFPSRRTALAQCRQSLIGGVANLLGNLPQILSNRGSAGDVVAHGGQSVTTRAIEPWPSGLDARLRRSLLAGRHDEDKPSDVR